MSERKKEDLRVVKTERAIRRAFEDMICEMDYSEISIKELVERAEINRKTFYLHYDSIEALLEKLQDEIVEDFISQNISYTSMADMRRITRFFFEYAASMPLLNERLLCSGSYSHIGDKINEKIMAYQAEKNRGAFSRNPLVDNLVFAYFAANSTILYRQWVTDGKQLPLEDLITASTNLICNGLSAYIR